MRHSIRLTLALAGAAALVLAMSGAAFAMGGGGMGTASMGSGNATHQSGMTQSGMDQSGRDQSGMTQSGTTMSDPVHDPGTGMTDPAHDAGTGMSEPAHDAGTGMSMSDPVHDPGTGMTDGTTKQHMFGDTAGTWYAGYADHMAENDYMHGYPNGDFGGNGQITRGQFATTMARMMGLEPSGEAPFGDTHGHLAEGHIAAMAAAGIISGHADGTFGPDEPITRAQMATLMDRAWDYLGLSNPDHDPQQLQNRLADAAGHWAEDHIGHMYALGITQGDEFGNFRPDENTIRAQAAAMLWRWLEVQ